MGYRHKVVRVTLQGTMLGGGEEWQTGFYMGQQSADATMPTQAWLDTVRDKWTAIFTLAANGFGSAYSFTQVKAALLGTDGKYDGGGEPMVSYPATAVNGGSAGLPLPPQCALVATLVAGSGKGLAGKGRMYLPGIKYAVDGSGHIGTADAQRTATYLSTFFNEINALAGAPGRVINASEGRNNPLVTTSQNLLVNGVRVGNVYDTQRRRRNSLAEVYSTAVVTDPA